MVFYDDWLGIHCDVEHAFTKHHNHNTSVRVSIFMHNYLPHINSTCLFIWQQWAVYTKTHYAQYIPKLQTLLAFVCLSFPLVPVDLLRLTSLFRLHRGIKITTTMTGVRWGTNVTWARRQAPTFNWHTARYQSANICRCVVSHQCIRASLEAPFGVQPDGRATWYQCAQTCHEALIYNGKAWGAYVWWPWRALIHMLIDDQMSVFV